MNQWEASGIPRHSVPANLPREAANPQSQPRNVAGCWLTYPSEKYESQLGWWHSQYMENYIKCSKPPTRWHHEAFSQGHFLGDIWSNGIGIPEIWKSIEDHHLSWRNKHETASCWPWFSPGVPQGPSGWLIHSRVPRLSRHPWHSHDVLARPCGPLSMLWNSITLAVQNFAASTRIESREGIVTVWKGLDFSSIEKLPDQPKPVSLEDSMFLAEVSVKLVGPRQ